MPKIIMASFEGLKVYLQNGSPPVTCSNVTDLYSIAYKLRLQPLVTRCLKYLAEAGPVGRQLVLLCNAAHVLATASETGVLLAALTWLEHDYEARLKFGEAVLGCVRFPLLPENILFDCMESDPPGRLSLQGPFVRDKLMEAVLFHYVTSRGRPDLAPKVRRRTFTGTEPAPQSLGTRSLPANAHPRLVFMRHSLTPNPVYQPLPSTSAVGSEVVQRAASRINDAHYRKREREVKVAQASVRGFLARKHYAKLHAKPKLSALGALHLTDLQVQKGTSSFDAKEQWDAEPALRALPRMTNLKVPGALILISGGLGPNERISTSCSLLGFTPKDCMLWRCGRLPQPRQLHASAYLAGYVYILGGFDVRNSNDGLRFATKTCFRLALSSGKWERLADMSHARCSHAAVVVEERIYAVAGQNELGIFLSSVEWYDPGSDVWSELAVPLPCRLSACGVASFRGSLHVAGGLVQTAERQDFYLISTLERWDGHRWTIAGPNLPSGRESLGLVEHEGKLYAIGGLARTKEGQLRVLPDVLIYDGQEDVWRIGPSLPESLHACHVASVGTFALQSYPNAGGDALESGPPNRHTATEQPARGTGSLAMGIQWFPWSWRITGLGCAMPCGDR
ncbi:hypothetical protein ISCGN_020147 [Ixodes scapularis]